MNKTCQEKPDHIKELCNCPFTDCIRWGRCCECLHNHRLKKQLPACFFPDDVAGSHERSIAAFIRLNS